MNPPSSVVLWFSLIVSGCLASPPSSLRLVSMLYRHGDRAPMFIYPKDINQADRWPDGIGWLTKTGKQQHYELGKWVRSRYEGFISSPYFNKDEITIESSSMPRCLVSAYSHLAGMFPPQGDQVWTKELAWQPIPVQTRPLWDDNKLAMFKDCPRYTELLERMAAGPDFQRYLNNNKEFFEMVVKETGITYKRWQDYVDIADTLFCEKSHNLKWNDWVYADGVWDKLDDLRNTYFDLIVNTSAMARLMGGPLLKEMIENMKAATTGYPQPKMYMYSAHDTTITALLTAMHAKVRKQPIIYGALVMVELHEIDSEFVVKIYYKNDTASEPALLIPKGCSDPCTLTELIEVTRDTVPEDWDHECKAKFLRTGKLPPGSWVALGIAIAFVITFVGVFIVWQFRLRGRRATAYSTINP